MEKIISCCNISKMYKLYDRPADRVKEAFGLSKKSLYKEHYALSNVDLDIYKGECVGIIGANGAGKSTLLKIITGVLKPSEGELFVNGRISALLELGAGFNQEYTGLENIYINGRMTGFSRDEVDEKLQDILDFADIGDFINQPVKTYSSGMFVRLAFAVAINIDPDILIVDEALAVGDVFFQAKCFNKFEEFKKQGKTILFVSHALGTIQKYCDRAVLLNHGVKIDEGKPKEIIDLYNKLLSAERYESIRKKERVAEDTHNLKEENTVANTKSGNDDSVAWKSGLVVNPKLIEYGSKEAEIVDFGIFNEENTLTNSILKGSVFTIRVKARFNAYIDNPILAYTIKDLKGVEITGANTLLANVDIGPQKPGDEVTVSFTQRMVIRSNEYLLCLGCTEVNQGEVMVYHRLYDVANISVMSSGDSVGLVDMYSEVEIESYNKGN